MVKNICLETSKTKNEGFKQDLLAALKSSGKKVNAHFLCSAPAPLQQPANRKVDCTYEGGYVGISEM